MARTAQATNLFLFLWFKVLEKKISELQSRIHKNNIIEINEIFFKYVYENFAEL